MADKIIPDGECENEFGKTRLVMFVMLRLNKTKRPGSYAIKSENFAIKKEKAALWKSGFQQRSCFLLRHHFKSSSTQPLLQTDYKTRNNHLISSNKGFAARQIALKEKEIKRKSRSKY